METKNKELMEKHQITSMQKTVFFYKEFKYDTLDSAVKYAEIDASKVIQQALDTELQK